jgi:hypothetical protein
MYGTMSIAVQVQYNLNKLKWLDGCEVMCGQSLVNACLM